MIRSMGELNRLADRVLDCAFEIHRDIGPGVRESVYERMMTHGLTERGLYVERQKPISFEHRGLSGSRTPSTPIWSSRSP